MSPRVAVVTGASRGIGRAIAVDLARDGTDIVAVARRADDLQTLDKELQSLGVRLLAVAADLATVDGTMSVAEQAWQWQGRVTTLVNAAGMLIRKAEADTEISDWDRTLALNARAPFFLMQQLGTRMYEAEGGSIVNIASIAGQQVTGAPATYQASKAALVQLTRFFANRLAPHVRVNAVGPGYVRTDLSADWLADPKNERWVEDRTPLERVALPEDVAGAVTFLASERAAYVTGQHLLVDGGWSVR